MGVRCCCFFVDIDVTVDNGDTSDIGCNVEWLSVSELKREKEEEKQKQWEKKLKEAARKEEEAEKA